MSNDRRSAVDGIVQPSHLPPVDAIVDTPVFVTSDLGRAEAKHAVALARYRDVKTNWLDPWA